jgi:hypothetical protein
MFWSTVRLGKYDTALYGLGKINWRKKLIFRPAALLHLNCAKLLNEFRLNLVLVGYSEPSCLRLDQGRLRCGYWIVRTGFTTFLLFLIWLSAGDWLRPFSEWWGRELTELSLWYSGSLSDTVFLVLVYERSCVRSANQCGGFQPWSPVELRRRPGM